MTRIAAPPAPTLSPPPPAELRGPLTLHAAQLPCALRNICALRTLERVALAFNAAGVPLLALKGAALNLTLYRTPHARPMSDLDLLVRRADVPAAQTLLGSLGCAPGAPLVRPDFFPQFHYECEYLAGDAFVTRIDLHARPLRPLRYAVLAPPDALWTDARPVAVGAARVLVPGPEDMLIHLAAHAAVHGAVSDKWRRDLRAWRQRFGPEIDWPRFCEHVRAWSLAWPVRRGLEMAGVELPMNVERTLRTAPVSWRERLALWHAPRDATHPAGHVLVNALVTPRPTLVARYLWAVAWPAKTHMAAWYGRRHPGWLVCAHAARLVRPLARGLAMAARTLARRRRAGHRNGV
jgi:hypothetical protein